MIPGRVNKLIARRKVDCKNIRHSKMFSLYNTSSTIDTEDERRPKTIVGAMPRGESGTEVGCCVKWNLKFSRPRSDVKIHFEEGKNVVFFLLHYRQYTEGDKCRNEVTCYGILYPFLRRPK